MALVVGLTTPALAAAWQEEISDFDRGRLERLAESKARGLAEAENGATARDLDIIHSVVNAEGAGVTENEIMGAWQCRTIKLGGMTPDVIYSWFRCRVRETKNGLYFEKLTGTQRMSGYLDDYNGGFLLLASTTVGHERARPYSGGNTGVGAASTHSDAVGMLTRIGERHLRIEFPYPFYESTFDLMELKR